MKLEIMEVFSSWPVMKSPLILSSTVGMKVKLFTLLLFLSRKSRFKISSLNPPIQHFLLSFMVKMIKIKEY